MANAIIAFAIAAATLVLLLVGASVALATASERRVEAVKRQGPHVKRVGGVLLVTIGLWFAFLAVANPIYLLP